MEADKSPKSRQPVHVFRADSIRREMGPLIVDNAIRQAIEHCWRAFPEEERTVEKVAQEIRRLVDRALDNFKEDAAAFGFVEDAPESDSTAAGDG